MKKYKITSKKMTLLPFKQKLRCFCKALIIIDEPELSMHIDWQRQLVNVMQQINPKAQIIMATHSPEIMADVNSDKIFRI